MSWIFRGYHGVPGSSLTRHQPKLILVNYLPHRTETGTEENDTGIVSGLKGLLPWLTEDSYFRRKQIYGYINTNPVHGVFYIPNLPTGWKLLLS